MKGKVSKTGYKNDSPDKDNDFNIIPSNLITMEGVSKHLIGIDDQGNSQLMVPGKDYVFKGKKVLEIPVKNNNMKKTPQIENFQDLLNLMEEGGPIVLQYPIDRMLPIAQDGVAVKSPAKLDTLQVPAKVSKVEQRIAQQYNLEGLPSRTEQATWNAFLQHVEKQYPENSEELKALNTGKPEEAKKRFNELASNFNTTYGKELYAKNSKLPGFDKNITEEQFIKDRMVHEGMMKNAQKVYGQQTAKDAWFGSETARTFYPTITGLSQGYQNPTPEQIKQLNATAAGKLAPVQVRNYKGEVVPYKGTVTIKGYSATGSPQYDYNTIKPYDEKDSANIYFDRANANQDVLNRFTPYITPSSTPAATSPRKLGGSPFTKSTLKSILGEVIKKQFGGSTAPQGLDTDSYIADKKATFANSLKKNVVKDMLEKEFMGMVEPQGGMRQEGGAYTGPVDENSEIMPPATEGQEQADLMARYAATDLTAGVDKPFTTEKDLNNFNKSIFGGNDKKSWLNPAVTGAKAVIDVFNQNMETSRANAYGKKAQEEARMKALTASVSGGRGDVDVNDFSFRPNKVGMPTYKLGGNYEMTQDEMVQFMAMGGQIKFID